MTPGNYNVDTFTTSTGGDITITLVSLSVPLTVEIQIGSVTNGACTPQFANQQFTVGTQWSNSVSGAGTYCVIIDDVATPNPPASLTFMLTILHPS